MEPSSTKQIKIDLPQSATLLPVVQLPEDMLGYIGKFIVKYPALHLFLPASKKLADCALKVFADFANAGGGLQFVHADPGLAIGFAKGLALRTLNLSAFRDIPEEDCASLFDGTWKIHTLAIPLLWDIGEKLSSLKKLNFLHLNNFLGLDLSFLTDLRGLTTLKLHCHGKTLGSLDCIHSLPHLKRLEIRQETFIRPCTFPLFTTLPGLVALKLETFLPKDFPKQLAKLRNLEKLNLKGCENEVYEPDEETIAAYQNMRTCFTNLTSLKLGRYASASWGFASILDTLTNLKTLHLDGFEGEGNAEIAEATCRRVSMLTSLIVFRTGNLILSKTLEDNIAQLGRLRLLELSLARDSSLSFLTRLTALHTLDIWGRGVLPKSFCGVGRLTSLTTLNLCNITLTSDTVGSLTTLTRLINFSLRQCTLSITPDAFVALTKLVALREIKVGPAEQFSSLPLQAMPNLSRLKLSWQFTPEEIDSLVGYICTLTQLCRLSFKSPHLSLTHASQLVGSLTRLEKLTLHYELFNRNFNELQTFTRILESKQIRMKKKQTGL